MFLIHKAEWLAPKVRLIEVEAPRVARHHQPGHFVIVRVHDHGERIPLTIAKSDRETGIITLIIQVVGATTELLCNLEKGESIANVVGPLGKPTEIRDFKNAVLVGGGVGTAVIYPQAKALKEAGNYVMAIVGGRTKDYVILEKQLAEYSDVVYPCTDDGSYGYHGFVTGKLKELLDDKDRPVGAVIAAGPVPMMRAIADVTRPYGVHTIVSLNPIMVDGTGMCGGCRVTIDGEMKFACVDGPEFDAHAVDFNELADRLGTYKDQEKIAWEKLHAGHKCRLADAAPATGSPK
ncbi:MAG: sulfide/dihydroorotate dehydrogenase-like FAD/NAD-binding protein [Phycisphaerae bacterium]|jgi:ferredoxin--NADP+ reductase